MNQSAILHLPWRTWREFVPIFLLATSLLAGAGSLHYYAETRAEKIAQETSEQLNVSLAHTSIARALNGVVSDLMYLAEHNQLDDLFANLTILQQQRLAQDFLVFSQQKGLYDQIRYLDANGREVVRINYNLANPVIVPSGELQNKAGRYYFTNTMALAKGQVYISPLDLNIEQGQIEQPPKPMLRFGTPVFDDNGQKRGVLLLNFLGAKLIADFRQVAANIADHIMLLNHDGYWLSSPEPEQEWGFMYGNALTFSSIYPRAWEQIQARDSGQLYDDQGLFSFATVYPLLSAVGNRITAMYDDTEQRRYYWKIVAHIPHRGLNIVPGFSRHLPIYGFMLALLAFGSWFLARARVRHFRAEAQIAFEQRFRETLENIELLALGLDTQGQVSFCNDALLQLSGWQRENIITQDWFERFIPAAQREQSRQQFQSILMRTGIPPHRETEIQIRGGEQRLIAWNDSLMFDTQERVIGLTCIGEDITEQRQAEESLRKLSRAVEQSPSTVMIVDTSGKIEYVNPKFTVLTGYTLAEVQGQNPRILKSGETSSQNYKTMWSTIGAGEEWRGVFHNRKKDGSMYWEAACISAIRNNQGEITHFLAVKEDITERKRLEREVEERNREIARTQALAVVGRMANMVAHDLRNPLSSVKMGLQILVKKTEQQLQESEREIGQIALAQVAYMEEFLEDLLSYSRPGALEPGWLNVDKLLNTAVLLNQRQIEQHRAQVNIWCQPGLPTLHGDARKLRRVFSNLIINAVQAAASVAERQPKISISAQLDLGAERPRIRIDICDNGQGFEAAQQGRLFEPFYTTRSKGTGLGLAIVKRIVDQHQGLVSLHAHENGGVCATVVLPTGPVDDERCVMPQATVLDVADARRSTLN